MWFLMVFPHISCIFGHPAMAPSHFWARPRGHPEHSHKEHGQGRAPLSSAADAPGGGAPWPTGFNGNIGENHRTK